MKEILDIIKFYEDPTIVTEGLQGCIADDMYIQLAEKIVKLFTIPVISDSLIRSKAKYHAKLLHQDEYNNPIYYRDVLETITNFEDGYKTALKDYNNQLK